MIEKMSSGISGLDQLLNGGFQCGSAYVLEGPPGAGKTILANQFCFSHVRVGGRPLYMSLLAESHDRMLAYISKMAFFNSSFVPGHLQYVSGFSLLDKGGLQALLKLVQLEVKRHNATAVVLDGIFVAHTGVSDAEYRKFVHELQGIANYANAVLVLLTQPHRHPGRPEYTMVDGWIELCDELKAFRGYRTIQIKKHRGSSIMGGKHEFRIGDEGICVFPRIEVALRSLPSHRASGRASTGIDDLDKMLGAGYVEASSVLVLGPPGSGKTTLGLHFLAQSTPEAPGIMLGFYEPPARLVKKAASIGLDLDAATASGAIELIWRPASENLVDELAWQVLAKAKAKGAKRVFVDGVAALRENLIVRDRLPYILNALNSQLSEHGVTTVYTSEMREMRTPDALPTDEVAFFFENVIILFYRRQEDTLRRTLSILKLRDSDFDPTAKEFHVGKAGIVFGVSPQLSDRGA